MTKQKIINYLITEGYNTELIKELNNKELYRIFILTLAFNTSITF